MGHFTSSLVWLLLAALGSTRGSAQLPFASQDAVPVGHGFVSIDFGLGYRNQARDFGVPDRDRQLDLGRARLTAGLGDWVEVQLTGTTYSTVVTNAPVGASERKSDFGDWKLGTKIRLLDEKARRPALGLLWEVKLPNASLAQGVGTDETDFFAQFLLSRSLGRRDRLHGNAGLGLLGIPREKGGQDDVSLLKVGWRHSFATALGGDHAEPTEPTEPPGGLWAGLEWTFQDGFEAVDSPIVARALIGLDRLAWSVYAAVGVGLNEEADAVAVEVGARRRLLLRRR